MRRFSIRLLCILLLSALLLCPAGCKDTELIDQVTNAQMKAEFNAPSGITELPAMADSDGRFTLPFSLSDTLDPYTCTTEVNWTFMPLLYDGLFSLNENYDWDYALCESFEANESSTMFRFTLREAYFPDGSQLNAYDLSLIHI